MKRMKAYAQVTPIARFVLAMALVWSLVLLAKDTVLASDNYQETTGEFKIDLSGLTGENRAEAIKSALQGEPRTKEESTGWFGVHQPSLGEILESVDDVARLLPDQADLQDALECLTWSPECDKEMLPDSPDEHPHTIQLGSFDPTAPETTPYSPSSVSISFAVSPQTVVRHESATLRWDVEGVREVYLNGEGVAGHGVQTVWPVNTQDYALRVVHIDGRQEYRHVRVVVASGPSASQQPVPPPPPSAPQPTHLPPSISFTADRYTVKAGESVLLSWRVENVTQLTLEGQHVPMAGSKSFQPLATHPYALRYVRSDGVSDMTELRITVIQPSQTNPPSPAQNHPTNPPTPPASGACPRKSQGDANCDGAVNGMDRMLLIRALEGQDVSPHSADFDGNGEVNGLDHIIWVNNVGTH